MSWEMVPAEMMDRKEVWQTLSEDMPVNAYVRNLATMTRLGVISPMDTAGPARCWGASAPSGAGSTPSACCRPC